MHSPRSLSVLAVVALAVMAGVLIRDVSPALAHAQYDSSTPGIGEQLTAAPTEVSITFTQEIQKVAGTYDIVVNVDRGLTVTAGPAVVNDADRTIMSVPLLGNLEDGRYVVRWKNVSDADGDPLEGAFSFYLNHIPNAVDLANDEQLAQIGAEPTAAAETPAAGETPVSATPEATSADGEPTAAATAGNGSESEDGDSSSNTWIIVGAIAIGLAAGLGAYAFARSRRR